MTNQALDTKNTFEKPILESDTIESLSAKLLDTTIELTKVNEQLTALQKEREEMLSNISHDLRAPITAIRSTIDFLLSGQEVSEDEIKSSLHLIDRRTRTLEDLIHDMYFLFCIEDTSKALQTEIIDAGPFLEEYYYDLMADSRYDTHDMQLDLPLDFHCKIEADVQKLIRVFDNLFTNAHKYTPADSKIVLEAHMAEELLSISITDNGPGIPEEALPHIFNRTYTVSRARTPGENSGSGLGLSIVKAIVERHSGTITCTNNKKTGCCFTIQLPVFSE